jgi:tRNA threonylcarbamoyladenosine biosynthesis protein TsaE
MVSNFNIISNSPEETIELGRRIGAQLKGGEVIAVCGMLGSGKTHLIKGIAAGAGAQDRRDVTSPTFVIVNEYSGRPLDHARGRLDIYHIDAYRLNSIAEFEMLGFDDFCYPQSVVLIEWADKVESALKNLDYSHIEISHTGRNKRKIHIKNAPEYMTFQGTPQ